MTVVYLLVAALVIVPYIAIIFFGSSKEKKLKKRFNEEVNKQNLNISEKESWNRHILGVDKEKSKLVFSQYSESGILETKTLDLNQVSKIDLYEKINTIKIDNKKSEVLDTLGLDFTLLNGELLTIRFYDTRQDVSQHYEREHAEKWRSIALNLKNAKIVGNNNIAA